MNIHKSNSATTDSSYFYKLLAFNTLNTTTGAFLAWKGLIEDDRPRGEEQGEEGVGQGDGGGQGRGGGLNEQSCTELIYDVVETDLTSENGRTGGGLNGEPETQTEKHGNSNEVCSVSEDTNTANTLQQAVEEEEREKEPQTLLPHAATEPSSLQQETATEPTPPQHDTTTSHNQNARILFYSDYYSHARQVMDGQIESVDGRGMKGYELKLLVEEAGRSGGNEGGLGGKWLFATAAYSYVGRHHDELSFRVCV